MNIIRSIINFFGAEDVVDGIGERGMRYMICMMRL